MERINNKMEKEEEEGLAKESPMCFLMNALAPRGGRYGDVQQLEHLNVDRHRFPIITTSSICELELIIDIVWSVVSRRHKNKIVFVDPLFQRIPKKKKNTNPFLSFDWLFLFCPFSRRGAEGDLSG